MVTDYANLAIRRRLQQQRRVALALCCMSIFGVVFGADWGSGSSHGGVAVTVLSINAAVWFLFACTCDRALEQLDQHTLRRKDSS